MFWFYFCRDLQIHWIHWAFNTKETVPDWVANGSSPQRTYSKSYPQDHVLYISLSKKDSTLIISASSFNWYKHTLTFNNGIIVTRSLLGCKNITLLLDIMVTVSLLGSAAVAFDLFSEGFTLCETCTLYRLIVDCYILIGKTNIPPSSPALELYIVWIRIFLIKEICELQVGCTVEWLRLMVNVRPVLK